MTTLDEFVEAHRHSPFSWLKNDCVGIGGDWLWARTGIDPIPEYRTYKTLMEALRGLKAHGGFFGLADERFGRRVGAKFMQREDVAIVHSGRKIGQVSGYTFGVCTGSHVVVPKHDGLAFLSIAAALEAWRQ